MLIKQQQLYHNSIDSYNGNLYVCLLSYWPPNNYTCLPQLTHSPQSTISDIFLAIQAVEDQGSQMQVNALHQLLPLPTDARLATTTSHRYIHAKQRGCNQHHGLANEASTALSEATQAR